jgi:hypothetical protein
MCGLVASSLNCFYLFFAADEMKAVIQSTVKGAKKGDVSDVESSELVKEAIADVGDSVADDPAIGLDVGEVDVENLVTEDEGVVSGVEDDIFEDDDEDSGVETTDSVKA